MPVWSWSWPWEVQIVKDEEIPTIQIRISQMESTVSQHLTDITHNS